MNLDTSPTRREYPFSSEQLKSKECSYCRNLIKRKPSKNLVILRFAFNIKHPPPLNYRSSKEPKNLFINHPSSSTKTHILVQSKELPSSVCRAGMASEQMKSVASALLVLNLCMYVIVLAIGSWAVNRAIDRGFIIGESPSPPSSSSTLFFSLIIIY